jgi:hypothetical protein
MELPAHVRVILPDTARPRLATTTSVCANRNCSCIIEPGQPIVRVPGSGWKHEDCTRPRRVWDRKTGPR